MGFSRRFPLIAAFLFAMLLGISSPAAAFPARPSFGFGLPLYNVAWAHAVWPRRPVLHQAWMVAQTRWPAVTAINTAQAVTKNCTGCEAAAIAFEIVIASDVSSLNLTNNASTIDTNCMSCDSAAIAEQWVVTSTRQRLVLTGAGESALMSVHLQLYHLLFSGATPSQISVDVVSLEAEIDDILRENVVLAPEWPRPPPASLPSNGPLLTGRSRLAQLALPGSGVAAGDNTTGETLVVTPEGSFSIFHYSQVSSGPVGTAASNAVAS